MSLLFRIKVQLVLESCSISGVHFFMRFLFVQQSETLYMHKKGFFSGLLNEEEMIFYAVRYLTSIRTITQMPDDDNKWMVAANSDLYMSHLPVHALKKGAKSGLAGGFPPTWP